MTYQELIEHAQYHDSRVRAGSSEKSYHAGQRNWACDMLRDQGFKIPAPVYNDPSILTDALASIAEIAQ